MNNKKQPWNAVFLFSFAYLLQEDKNKFGSLAKVTQTSAF